MRRIMWTKEVKVLVVAREAECDEGSGGEGGGMLKEREG